MQGKGRAPSWSRSSHIPKAASNLKLQSSWRVYGEILQGSRSLPLTTAVDKFPVFRVTSLVQPAALYTTDMVMRGTYSHLDVRAAAEQWRCQWQSRAAPREPKPRWEHSPLWRGGQAEPRGGRAALRARPGQGLWGRVGTGWGTPGTQPGLRSQSTARAGTAAEPGRAGGALQHEEQRARARMCAWALPEVRGKAADSTGGAGHSPGPSPGPGRCNPRARDGRERGHGGGERGRCSRPGRAACGAGQPCPALPSLPRRTHSRPQPGRAQPRAPATAPAREPRERPRPVLTPPSSPHCR